MSDVRVLCEQKFSADPLARGDGAVKRKYFTKAAGFFTEDLHWDADLCRTIFMCLRYGIDRNSGG